MNKTTKTFKITTILLSIIDIFAIIFFAVSLSLALSQKTILIHSNNYNNFQRAIHSIRSYLSDYP